MDIDFSNDVIEKLLLKRILVDKKYMNILSTVFDKRWFKVPTMDVLFGSAVNFYKKYEKLPSLQTVLAIVKKYAEVKDHSLDLTQVQQLLNEVNNLDLNVDDEVINANLKEFIRKKSLYYAMFDNIENLESKSDEVIDNCLAKFDKVQKITFNDIDLGLNYFDLNQMDQHWEKLKNPEAKVKTGWDAIDEYTNGGFLSSGKSLYIFMGQAGLGKSVFLSNLAVNFLKKGKSVVVISLEMSEDVYATRFDAHISKCNINKLAESSETAISRIKEFYKQYPTSNLFIKEYPPRSIKTSDIDLYLENLKNNGNHFDVIVVDYLNLVLSSHGSDNMYKDALDVSEKLRALSYKYKAPVITAVQANTEGMNNENIGMEHISESRGIAHTADFLLGLYQMQEDRENGKINGRILKNRLGGQVGKVVSMKLDPESLILADITFDSNFDDNVEDDGINNIIANQQKIASDLDDLYGD